MSARLIQIASEAFDPEEVHKAFRAAVSGAGAIVAFTGLVRGGGCLLYTSPSPRD